MRSAVLVPRRLGDYLPAWLPNAIRLVTLTVAILAVALTVLPVRADQGWNGDPAAALLTGLAAVAVAVAVAVELLTRWLVWRRQPVTDGYRIEVDDALRSTSVHATDAAALALVLLLLAGQFGRLGGVDLPLIGWFSFVAQLACWGAAIGCLIDLAQRHRWTVRRNLRPAGQS